MKFARAKRPVPLLDTANFLAVFGGKDGASLPLDNQGLMRPLEMIAFPGTTFEIQEEIKENQDTTILHLKTEDYPEKNVFADYRFLHQSEENIPPRKAFLPSTKEIIQNLTDLVGMPYLWGGNWSEGIEEMLTLYPPQKPLDAEKRRIWALKGVDCSGLLYEATRGATPRNTSQLLFFGKDCAGSSFLPLDLIVWPGHVLIVLDENRVIESRASFGVIISPLKERLEEIKQRKDLRYKRFHPEQLGWLLPFRSTVSPLPLEVIDRMRLFSWTPECPVSLHHLRYLTLTHFGFDGKVHTGELVMHYRVADEVIAIFKDLYEARFPIEKMKLIDEYGGSDHHSMSDNNSSGFCFREAIGKPGIFSKHSFGLAIDINPLYNPYRKKELILPPEGEIFLDRSILLPGMISENDPCHRAFSKRGWIWGGVWEDRQDYHHFERSL